MPSSILASGIVQGSPRSIVHLAWGRRLHHISLSAGKWWCLTAWCRLCAGNVSHLKDDDRVVLERSGRALVYLTSSSGPSTLASDGILLLNGNVYWRGEIPPRRSFWFVAILALLELYRGFTVCIGLEETQTYENLTKYVDHYVNSFTICSIVILGIWALGSFHFLTYIKNCEILKNYRVGE